MMGGCLGRSLLTVGNPSLWNLQVQIPGVVLGRWVTHRKDGGSAMEIRYRGQLVRPHQVGCSCRSGWTLTCSLKQVYYTDGNSMFHTLKSSYSQWNYDQTPESFVAIFLFQTCHFVNLAFPKQCKWIRSDYINFTPCDIMGRDTPPTRIPQQKCAGCLGEAGGAVNVGACCAIPHPNTVKHMLPKYHAC